MAETVDELTVTYEDGGIETVKELDKKVLTKGAWATVMYPLSGLESCQRRIRSR